MLKIWKRIFLANQHTNSIVRSYFALIIIKNVNTYKRLDGLIKIILEHILLLISEIMSFSYDRARISRGSTRTENKHERKNASSVC